VDIPNTRSRRKSILVSSPRENKHTRRKSVQISLSPVECPSIQSKSWQPTPADTQLADAPHRRRRDSRSRSKSVNQVLSNNLHFPDQRSQSLLTVNLDADRLNTDKSRRRRRSRSGSKSFHMEDRDEESPALNSLQEMISSLKQIPPSKGSLDHHNPLSSYPTTSPASLDFLRTADLDNGETIIAKHVSQSPTSHEPIYPNAKSWNSVDEDYQHGSMMGTSQGFTNYFPQRMNSYGSHGRKFSYSSYSSR
jgi:hypothetical protein